MRMSLRFGIDLGGTKTEIIALQGSDERLRRRLPTPQGDYPATLQTIVSLVREAEAQLGSRGVGIPGTRSPDHGRIKNANSTCLIGKDLQGDLERLLERPVRLANDADCFTLSEASDGAGAGADNVFGVILGTGVGGGIAIHGRLLSGPNAIAGEWGHNALPWRSAADGPATEPSCALIRCSRLASAFTPLPMSSVTLMPRRLCDMPPPIMRVNEPLCEPESAVPSFVVWRYARSTMPYSCTLDCANAGLANAAPTAKNNAFFMLFVSCPISVVTIPDSGGEATWHLLAKPLDVLFLPHLKRVC